MKKTFQIAATIVGLSLAASSAGAATLATITHDYGTGPGQVDPSGNDPLNANSVTVRDSSTSRFSDSFDFSGVAYDTIDSLSLTLDFSGAGPRLSEAWAVRIQGDNSATLVDDLFTPILDFASPQTITISAASDILSFNAFATSLANENLEFWFSEFTVLNDEFTLNSATLTIEGTAPAAVPLPAGMPLLLLGLGGIAALRRRKSA